MPGTAAAPIQHRTALPKAEPPLHSTAHQGSKTATAVCCYTCPPAGAVRPAQHFDKDGSAPMVSMGDIMRKEGAQAAASASASSSGQASAAATATASSDNGCTDVAPSGSTCQQQKVSGRWQSAWWRMWRHMHDP
jgi:hypothetical protein